MKLDYIEDYNGLQENIVRLFNFDKAEAILFRDLLQETIIDNKQKGIHLFGKIDSISLQVLTRNNIEWVTLVPWGVQDDYNSAIMNHHNSDSLLIRQSDSSWVKRLELVHSAGFKIFVKPHVWIDSPSDGKWRSDIFPSNETNWKTWQKSYREFILMYAKIAQENDVAFLQKRIDEGWDASTKYQYQSLVLPIS